MPSTIFKPLSQLYLPLDFVRGAWGQWCISLLHAQVNSLWKGCPHSTWAANVSQAHRKIGMNKNVSINQYWQQAPPPSSFSLHFHSGIPFLCIFWSTTQAGSTYSGSFILKAHHIAGPCLFLAKFIICNWVFCLFYFVVERECLTF